MDELTPLRNTHDDGLAPSDAAREKARTQLLERAVAAPPARPVRLPRRRRPVVRRAGWALAAVAAVVAGIVVAGNIGATTPSASAAQVMLRRAAAQTIKYADPVPGPGQYLHLHRVSEYQVCTDPSVGAVCSPSRETIDLYVPADRGTEWVLRSVFDDYSDNPPTESARRAIGGKFIQPLGFWGETVPNADIPTDGDAAYAWIDGQYSDGPGGRSRDDENFWLITRILDSGLVTAAPRAALLEALAKVPGVTVTEGVANRDGVTGVAIGREAEEGRRDEIIIDPDTGLMLGTRDSSFRLTVVDAAPAWPDSGSSWPDVDPAE